MASLTPWPDNPRKNDQAVDAVADSIKRFGFGAPILARKADGEIIAGHTRLKAAAKLGIDRVPVRYLDLDPADAHLLALADNKIGEKADWDDEQLARLLAELDDESRAAAGFENDEITKLLDGLESAEEADPDDCPEPPPEPVSQLGDVWRLGEHVLRCGDSRDALLWDGVEAEMVWTDPPYGVAYVGKTKDALTIQNDKLSPEKLQQFLRDALGLALAATKPGGAWYVAAPPGPLHHQFAIVLHEFDVWRALLVWAKDALVLGHSDYHYKHEPIFYGWRPGAEHRFRGDRKQTSVLEFARPKRSAEHPTMKPVELVEYCIKQSSLRGDLVADPFGGSGTTLIACERTGRRCFTIELAPRYCDVIVQRWEKLTGRKAERRGTQAA